MEFKNCGDRFKVRMKKEDGSYFFGTLSIPVMSNNRTLQFVPVRRILRVDIGSGVEIGDCFFTNKGEGFLCASNGDVEGFNSDLKTLLAVPLTKKAEWSRVTTQVDRLTGMKCAESKEVLGEIWVCLEANGVESDTLRVDKEKYRIMTGADVKEGDFIDGIYKIKRVDEIFGVRLAYA